MKSADDAPAATAPAAAGNQPDAFEQPAPAPCGHVGAGDDEQTFAIGELADEFNITTRTIRFYEARGLLNPSRRGSSRRYTRRDRARLSLILRGKNLGFSLEDIAEYLALYDADPGQVTQTRLLLDKVSAAIIGLKAKRADLERALSDLQDIQAKCVEHLKAAKRP